VSGLGSVVLTALISIALLGCTSTETPGPLTATSPDDAPAETTTPVTQESLAPTPINLGVAPGRYPGQTPIDALIHVEQLADRRFDVVRAYAFWDSEFPDLRHLWVGDAGQLLHLSINARRTDGSVVPWHEIATAPEGDPVHDELAEWIDRLADYEAPIRVTFHHEADIEPEFGSADDFVAAWRRFVSLLDVAAPNIETVWVITAFNMDKPTGEQFWPGDDHVDIIGADAFNWFGCRGNPEAWRSPQQVLAPLMAFGADHPDKPLVLAELGSDEDPGNADRKAAWLDELIVLVADAGYERLDTIVFFHNDHDADSSCEWWLDSSETSADAFATLATLPLFGGDVALSPPAQCPAIATVFSSTDDLALVDGDGDGRFDFEFGDENRFIGLGDQSNDGSDHRVLLEFGPVGQLPPGATVELRIRIGERQPLLTSQIELRLLDDYDTARDAFSQEGELLEPALFDADSAGGHHVLDLTGLLDTNGPTSFRLQLATPPLSGDGQSVLFVGTGDAARSIDRPALIARHCE